jgi:hypothetical protein
MEKVLTSVNEAVGKRVGISFNMDNCQTTMFLTQEGFLQLMAQMFDYRDSHKEELQEVVKRLYG